MANEKIYISAEHAAMICADSGDIIYEKNSHSHTPMASTTKIMTSILALEKTELEGNKEIEITNEMINVEGSSMGLNVGDKVTLEQLVIGMLLPSGNDAANATAICISGSIEKFVESMNQKAKKLGMNDTCFFTPSGLDYENHHSSAYDMALLGAYAMENKKFTEIACKKKETIILENGKKIYVENHNKLLKFFKECIGVKTGYTKRAGRCLVSCAEKDNKKIIVTTLDAPNDWNDHIALYNYGFKNIVNKTFKENIEINLTVKNGTQDKIECSSFLSFSSNFNSNTNDSEIKREIILPKFINAPILKDQILGEITYSFKGKIIQKNELKANFYVPKLKTNFLNKSFLFFKKIFKLK